MQYKWPVPNEEQDQTPYATALMEQAPEQWIRAQAPGHGGLDLPEDFEQFLHGAHKFDVSVMKNVDVLAEAGTTTPLKQAEALWAKLYGAKLARVLTTGATFAAKAAVLALLETVGYGRIAVHGACHISVTHALKNARARAVIMPPRIHALGCATVLDPDDLERVLKQYPDIRGVVISTPSYEGAVSKLQRLVEIAHAHGAVVMVDSSWGSELELSPRLPMGPLQAGADIIVLSPHKSMWALGQTACVILPHGSRIADLTFGAALLEAGSTSKNSVMLAIADIGRRYAALNAGRLIERSIAVVKEEEDRLLQSEELRHLVVPWNDMDHIPYRPLINVTETGYTGYELEPMLREKHVQVAQANIGYLCFGFGVGADESIRAMFSALVDVVRGLKPRPRIESIPHPPLRLREIDFGVVPGREVEVVPLREAIDRVAALPLGTYPPGICGLIQGAPIAEVDVDFIEEIVDASKGKVTMYGHPEEVPAGHVAVIRE